MVIEKGGLEFYPLGGDPRKLSEYMVCFIQLYDDHFL